MPEATTVEKECCSEPERKQSLDGATDDRHGSGADADVVASPTASSPAVADTKPKRQRTRAPAKKVAMATSHVRPDVDVADPLFFAGLNILHKRLEADARRTRFSSMSIA